MKTYTTYQQIKDEFKNDEDLNKPYDVFTNYVMDVISLEQRKSIRSDWNTLQVPISWQDYLLERVNRIKNDNMKTIKSYLCLFPGFYNTLFDNEHAIDITLETIDESIEYDDIEWDNKEYQDRVAKSCIESIENYLKQDGFDIEIIFDEVHSPRQYNYSNDSINCTYKITNDSFNELLEYAKTNLSDFKEFLKENYSSCSGFISFYSTDVEKWFNEYLKDDSTTDFENTFVGLLNFYLQNEGYTVDDMLDDCLDEVGYIDYEIKKEIV